MRKVMKKAVKLGHFIFMPFQKTHKEPLAWGKVVHEQTRGNLNDER